jgi:hypothetical protein
MLNGMVRRVAALSALVLLLGGCSLFPSARDQAADRLQERLDSLHQSMLEWRAGDPTSSGSAALAGFGSTLHAEAEGDTLTLVLPVAVRVETGGGLFAEQASLGACVLVWVKVGEDDRDRGEVLTAPVTCPEGAVVEFHGGGAADELTTDLDHHWDDVPQPEPHYEPCISGELCDHGGG